LISFEPSPAAYGFVTFACLVRSFFAPDPIDKCDLQRMFLPNVYWKEEVLIRAWLFFTH
jgi:hypothetical protein